MKIELLATTFFVVRAASAIVCPKSSEVMGLALPRNRVPLVDQREHEYHDADQTEHPLYDGRSQVTDYNAACRP